MARSVSHSIDAANELRHQRGCPSLPARTEVTTSLSPVTKRNVTIARCCDCGAQIVLDQDGSDFATENSLELEGQYGKEARKPRGSG